MDSVVTVTNVFATQLRYLMSSYSFQDPMQVLKMLDVENAKLYVDFLVLGIFFTVIRVATFLVLHWKVRAER